MRRRAREESAAGQNFRQYKLQRATYCALWATRVDADDADGLLDAAASRADARGRPLRRADSEVLVSTRTELENADISLATGHARRHRRHGRRRGRCRVVRRRAREELAAGWSSTALVILGHTLANADIPRSLRDARRRGRHRQSPRRCALLCRRARRDLKRFGIWSVWSSQGKNREKRPTARCAQRTSTRSVRTEAYTPSSSSSPSPPSSHTPPLTQHRNPVH